MTHTAPRLTSELLDRTLRVAPGTAAPADLYGSIAAAIHRVPQRQAPFGARISRAFAELPRPARLAMTALLLVGLVAAIAVGAQLLRHAGPLDDSLTFRGDVARTGVVDAPGPGAGMTIAYTKVLPGQIVTSPSIADGVAYVGATDGRFRAFDLARGVELWAADVHVAWSSPSIVGDLVLVGTEDRALVALDRRSGQVAWALPLDAFVGGSPAVVGDRVYVATSSTQSHGRPLPGATGTVVAIDLGTLSIAWREHLPGPSTHSIAVDGATLVVPTDVGIAVAFDTATGRELWRAAAPPTTDTPVIAGGKVFLAGLDLEGTRGSLVAVDLGTGRVLWPHARPSGQTIVAPAVDPAHGILYAGTVDGDVVALRADDGTSIWTRHLGTEVGAPPTKAGDLLYVAATNRIAALDAATGRVVASEPIDGIPFAPALAGGYLVAGTQSGRLYVLGPPGAVPVASGGSTPPATTLAGTLAPPSTPIARPPARPVVEVWSRTPGDLGIDQPYYVNIAPDGHLWIGDSGRGRFVIVGPDGAVADIFEPTGEAALDLVQPDADGWGAVAFAPDGAFYVADSDHQRVVHFGADREVVGSWGAFGSGPGQFVSPFGIAVGPDGLVYVVDDPTCRIQVFDPSGTYLRTVAGGADFIDRCTNNVIVDAEGNVYLASGGRGDPWRITQLGADGRVVRRIGEGLLREPVLLGRGPEGEIYATDGTDTLHRFGADGELLGSWSGSDLELAVIGPGGEVYASGSSGAVHRYELPPDGAE